MHGEIQGLGTALLNAFRLECSLPRKKETKILYFVILISKCHTDMCMHEHLDFVFCRGFTLLC